ncbi:MAG: N-acetylmuramoyl-L-alanine amidase [Bacteroidales bacterium]|nr:N-acetylmuramoyl-L-alanine amidase [Bacteroidales bacterium]MBQ2056151.1 N-acetylmuramoyl-L-alanine amidase [Bacteroidaceae bacterium]MBQ2573038.1 N-acetylmuramoyl-L-alanine amidase [Bacteroidales bacterium]MBQ3831961.1 N-acetylmuramoyl-L-alanine amidase [Bacteroidales bacterium]MBQ7484675.1 N-acetylmuramoyl-L-alanine amidase [Bacteroidaceae bacterium]
MREITEIIIHCSATKEGHPFFAADIDRWHKAQGWSGIGYHYVIDIDGKVETGRAEYQTGAHAKGHNANSIGICYIGGLDINGKPKDTRTPEQRKSLAELVARLKVKYPKATVHGHNEFANKACPCFNVRKEF